MKIFKTTSEYSDGESRARSRIELEVDLISRIEFEIDNQSFKTEFVTVGWLQELTLFLRARLPDAAWYRRSLMFSGTVFEAKQLQGYEAEIMLYDVVQKKRVAVRFSAEEIRELIESVVATVSEKSATLAQALLAGATEALEEWVRRGRDNQG